MVRIHVRFGNRDQYLKSEGSAIFHKSFEKQIQSLLRATAEQLFPIPYAETISILYPCVEAVFVDNLPREMSTALTSELFCVWFYISQLALSV